MDFDYSTVKKVHEEHRPWDVNRYLREGWVLLSHCKDAYGTGYYVLGWTKEEEPSDPSNESEEEKARLGK